MIDGVVWCGVVLVRFPARLRYRPRQMKTYPGQVNHPAVKSANGKSILFHGQVIVWVGGVGDGIAADRKSVV